MNLSSREKQVLSLLNTKHGIVTSKELSTKLGVTERTIRSDIRDINTLLESYEIKIEAVHGKGYSLNVKDRVALVGIFSEEALYRRKRGAGIPTAVISHYNESITHYLMENLKYKYGGYLKLYGPFFVTILCLTLIFHYAKTYNYRITD